MIQRSAALATLLAAAVVSSGCYVPYRYGPREEQGSHPRARPGGPGGHRAEADADRRTQGDYREAPADSRRGDGDRRGPSADSRRYESDRRDATADSRRYEEDRRESSADSRRYEADRRAPPADDRDDRRAPPPPPPVRGGQGYDTDRMPAQVPGLNGGPSACRYALSQGNPILTEWPAAEKSNLESMLRGGAVAVEFTGCAMKLLPQCRVGGRYVLERTTLASDSIDINSAGELFAKLPLGAVSLEGELKRTGRLVVKTHVAGQARLREVGPEQVPNTAECARATHVIASLSVGAFSLLSGGELSGKASAEVAKIGEAGGKASRSAEVVRSAGDPDACSRGDEAEPHFNCRSPIQAFLQRIPGRGDATEAPAGTIKVDLLSSNANSRWDVYYDDEVICTTPCSKWLDPSRPLLFRTRDEGFYGRGADKVRVPDLMAVSGAGMVQVQAVPTAFGKQATGIVFTSFGGMAAVTGIALTGVGCSNTTERGGLCRGGLITLGIGGLVTAGSIMMILDSLPHAEFRVPGGGTGNVLVGPGFATGRF